jgi:hypothetical protein
MCLQSLRVFLGWVIMSRDVFLFVLRLPLLALSVAVSAVARGCVRGMRIEY